MFIKIFLNYILGFVKISVEGYFTERFINICISKKIFLWNIKKEKSTFLKANVGVKDFFRLKSVAKKTKCKVNIENKKGLPFILNRYKKRKIFAIFLILIIFSIMITSRFVWNIEVIGNEKISKEEVINSLQENGLKTGSLKNAINAKEIINAIRLKRQDIAWMSIDLKGTNAVVEIVEASQKPEIIDKNEICNIVSDREGIISKINVQNGTAQVKVGDLIQKGTILVGGYIEGKYTGTRYVHSSAEIEARVWYSKKEKMNLTTEINVETNEKKDLYSINFNNFRINLYKNLPNFQKYDTINENKKIRLFSDFYLPIELIKTTYKELETKEITYEKEEAKNLLINKIREDLNTQIEDKNKIINEQINTYDGDGFVEVEVVYEVIENIGTKEKINM